MRRSIQVLAGILAATAGLVVCGLPGCTGSGSVGVGGGITTGSSGSSGTTGFTTGLGSTGSTTTRNTTATGTSGTSGTTASNGTTSSSTGCTGLQCQVASCPGGGDTTISGVIKDPAGKNPLYNVVAYIPNSSLDPLPRGAVCSSCSSLFSGDPIADGISDATGSFKITGAPSGTNIPVVVQVGKWRTHTVVPMVTACTDNPIPGGSINFPSAPSGDGIDNIPDIAVSTGGADSLECLMIRMGIASSQYVAGNDQSGRIHIFNGGNPANSLSGSGPGGPGGYPESPQMTNAPASDQALWDKSDGGDMAPYDIVMLSCEGDETYNANPPALESYLNNMGGRVFASHYHYAWFSGPLDPGNSQSYSAPSDWLSAPLAAWTDGSPSSGNTTNGDVVQTLWNNTVFPKGQALASWLGTVGALGTVPSNFTPAPSPAPSSSQLFIAEPRNNADVTSTDPYSQPWITDSQASSAQVPPTLYFSFNTPVGQTSLGEGSTCQGRAVFSGLHVGGASTDGVNCTPIGFGQYSCDSGLQPTAPVKAPPEGCASGELSPQEKALEFMIFDLSSCVVPDTAVDAGNPIKFQ